MKKLVCFVVTIFLISIYVVPGAALGAATTPVHGDVSMTSGYLVIDSYSGTRVSGHMERTFVFSGDLKGTAKETLFVTLPAANKDSILGQGEMTFTGSVPGGEKSSFQCHAVHRRPGSTNDLCERCELTFSASGNNGTVSGMIIVEVVYHDGSGWEGTYDGKIQCQSQTEDNKALVVRYFQAQAEGDADTIAQTFAPDYKRYLSAAAPPLDAAGQMKRMAGLRAAFPDLNGTVDAMIAEGDTVVAQLTIQGTHQGEFMGIAPTGKTFKSRVIEIIRIEDGKFVKHWGGPDTYDILQQLGVFSTGQ